MPNFSAFHQFTATKENRFPLLPIVQITKINTLDTPLLQHQTMNENFSKICIISSIFISVPFTSIAKIPSLSYTGTVRNAAKEPRACPQSYASCAANWMQAGFATDPGKCVAVHNFRDNIQKFTKEAYGKQVTKKWVFEWKL